MKRSTTSGCFALLILFAAIAIGSDRLIGPDLRSDVRIWIDVADGPAPHARAWQRVGARHRLRQRNNSRDAIMRRAIEGKKPTADGPTIATGVVRPLDGSLRAPISGIECVAYLYRMYYLTRAPESRGPDHVPSIGAWRAARSASTPRRSPRG